MGNRAAEIMVHSVTLSDLDDFETFVQTDLSQVVTTERFANSSLVVQATDRSDRVDSDLFMALGTARAIDPLEVVGASLNVETVSVSDQTQLEIVLEDRFGMSPYGDEINEETGESILSFTGLKTKQYEKGCEATIADILHEYVQTDTLAEGEPVYEDRTSISPDPTVSPDL